MTATGLVSIFLLLAFAATAFGKPPSAHDQAVTGFHNFIQSLENSTATHLERKIRSVIGKRQFYSEYTDCCVQLVQQGHIRTWREFFKCLDGNYQECTSSSTTTTTTTTTTQASPQDPTNGQTTSPPNQVACGKAKFLINSFAETKDNSPRVVGGTEATPGEIPFIAALQLSAYGYRKQIFCGGSIYNEKYIITAAHCIDEGDDGSPTSKASNLKVILAEHDTAGIEGAEQTIQVLRIIKHESYDGKNVKNDIALLELEKPIDFTSQKVAPVCLPTSCSIPSGKCLIAGWGTTRSGGSTSNVLLKAMTTVLSANSCRSAYGTGYSENKEICARQSGIDTCQGDSGGPLTCAVDGAHHLFGVVSWGYGCADEYYPGVYTKVCNYIDWIKSNAS